MKELQPEYFYFLLPLYTPIKLQPDDSEDLVRLLRLRTGRGIYDSDKISVEGYNPLRQEKTTYDGYSMIAGDLSHFLEYGGVERVVLKCKRFEDEAYFLIKYNSEEGILMKVGQYPSIADFHIWETRKYRSVLSPEKLRELNKGIGLAANGVGIGSFVYLRRIFEALIEEAHTKAKVTPEWNPEVYKKAKVNERIEILSEYLPTFLVENSTLYGILSKGIHQLEEEECLTYFDVVKTGIELILDEKLEAHIRQKKIAEAKQKLQQLHKKLK